MAAVALLVLYQCIAEPAGAEQLSKELSVGLPEPTEDEMDNTDEFLFCPLGVCRPRSRDSLWAAGSFGLAALTSVWLGRRRSRGDR